VRREVWNAARKHGQAALARELKGARSALWKNPGDLTARQRAKLAWIAQVNDRLYRAYLLKEEPGLVFTLKGVRATVLLQAWLAWAKRCRIPAFVELAKAIARHRADIQAALTQGLSSGPSRPSTPRSACPSRVAFGFKSPEALIALAMLSLGGLCPSLPGRG
jgi:transposase